MSSTHFVSIRNLCIHYDVAPTFFDHLIEYELIEISRNDDIAGITEDQVIELEKIIRLYHELEVNMEGIDVVLRLLKTIVNLQEELMQTRNRLRLYED